MKNINVKDLVYSYQTKSEYGFTDLEMKEIIKNFPNINMKKFNDALMGNTCMLINDEVINYHCDVHKAILCGIENRDLKASEWD